MSKDYLPHEENLEKVLPSMTINPVWITLSEGKAFSQLTGPKHSDRWASFQEQAAAPHGEDLWDDFIVLTTLTSVEVLCNVNNSKMDNQLTFV